MKKFPAFLKGAHQGVVRLAMQEALSETRSDLKHARGNSSCCCREFFFFKQGRGGFIPENKPHKRFAMFAEGQAAATAHKAGALC